MNDLIFTCEDPTTIKQIQKHKAFFIATFAEARRLKQMLTKLGFVNFKLWRANEVQSWSHEDIENKTHD